MAIAGGGGGAGAMGGQTGGRIEADAVEMAGEVLLSEEIEDLQM